MDAVVASRAAVALKRMKHRVAVVEATTGGLVGASLVACPGASSFFMSSCVVYTGRGYKTFLPPEVLEAAEVFDREKNYSDGANYVESKKLFVWKTSEMMKKVYRADWCLVESGTSGPEFYIPGVASGFTAVGVAGPVDRRTGEPFLHVDLIHTGKRDREENMKIFAEFALRTFADCLEEFQKHYNNTESGTPNSKL